MALNIYCTDVCVCVLICPARASVVFERTVNPEEPECSQGSLSVVDEALSSLTDSQFPSAPGH